MPVSCQGVYRGFSDCYSGALIAIIKTLSNYRYETVEEHEQLGLETF